MFRLSTMVRCTGPQKPSISEMINESDCSLIHPQERRSEREADHFRESLSWLTDTVNMPLMPPSEPMQADTSHSSETEAIRVASFL